MKRLQSVRLFLVTTLFMFSIQVMLGVQDEDVLNERAFSNSTNFASETLFSASDFGRKTFHVFKSSNYRLTKAVNYQPSTEVASSPMIKITASSVTIDLNGFTVSRQDTDVNGASCPNAVGIEIGYSPYDIAQGKFGATSTFSPENVTIRNGVLDNFGIGIVIHAGVKNVVLEDLTITRSALGVVCAGQTAKQVASITLKNVTITGDGTDRSIILAWAKAKLEDTDLSNGYMQYGADTIMSKPYDPTTDNNGPGAASYLEVYSGVLSVYTNNVVIENSTVTNLGFKNFASSGTESNHSATYAIDIRYGNNITLDHVDVSNNGSLYLASGLHVSNCSVINIHDVQASNNQIVSRSGSAQVTHADAQVDNGLWVRGVSFVSSNSISIDGLDVSKTLGAQYVTRNSLYGTSAMGVYCVGVTGIQMNSVQARAISSQNTTTQNRTLGLYTDVITNIQITHSDFSAISDFGTGSSRAKALLFEGAVTNIILDHVYIIGTTSAAGQVVGIHFMSTATNVKMNDVHVDGTNSTTGAVIGLNISEALNTLEIKNSSFDNTSASGAAANVVGIWLSVSVNSLILENITVNYTWGPSATTAVCGLYVQGISVRDINVNMHTIYVLGTTGGSSGNVYGIYFEQPTNVAMNDVHADSTNSTGAATYGMYVTNVAKDIEIKNATFDNTNASGDSAIARGVYFASTVDTLNLENVTINKTTVSDADTAITVRGLLVAGEATSVTMKNVQVNNTTATTSGSATSNTTGVGFTTSLTGATIDGLQVNNTTAGASGSNTFGIYINSPNSVTMKNVQCNGGTSTSGNNSIIGISLQTSAKNIVLENVEINGQTKSSANVAFGLYVGAGNNVQIKNISASGNTGVSECYGLYFDTSAENISIDGAQINNNTAVQAYGIRCVGVTSKMYLHDVDILDTTSTTSIASGLYFANTADDIGMDGVHIDGTNATSGNAYGLYITSAANNINMKNSSCNGTRGTLTSSNVYGIWIVTSVNSLTLENVTVDYTSTPTNITSPVAYGMRIKAANGVVAKNVAVNNTTSESARGIWFESSLNSAQIDGLQVNGTSAAVATTATYGILIDSPNSVTMKNVQCNGTTSSSGAFDLYGLALTTLAKNIFLENIEVNNCTKSGSNQTFAFYVDAGNGMDIKNLSASGNTGVTQCIGARFAGSTNNISIDGCQVKNNTATTAYGLHMTTLNGVTVKNIAATGNAATGGECFGVYAATSAANVIIDSANVSNNTGTTTVGGMYLATADSVQLKNMTANNNGGTLNGIAIGIQCGGTASDVLLENIVASGNTGSAPITAGAGGIFFAGTNSGLTFKNVVATNNIVTAATQNSYAYGIKLASGNALTFEDVNCSYNVGPNHTQSTNDSDAGDWNTVSCAGVWLVDPTSVEMKNITCDYNTLGGTSAAAYTFGILLDNPSDVTIDSVSCSHNVGNAHVSGLFANGGSSVSVSNGQFSSNMQQGTGSATVQTSVVTITPNGNLSKHSVLPDTGVDALGWVGGGDDLFDAPESIKGAFGIFAKDVEGVSIDTISACNNTGFRAIGIECLGCTDVQMTDCVTSGQSAIGDLFLDDADVDLAVDTDGDAVTFPARYLSASIAVTPDIFGVTYDPVLDHINLQDVTVSVLDNAKLLKDASSSGNWNDLEIMYGYHEDFVTAELLVRAAVAKVRAWGVAVGTQIQDCTGVQINNLTACANSAEKDSAIGLMFANHCTDCIVSGGQFTSNQAWTDSQLTITPGDSTGTIDITAMAPFWTALDMTQDDEGDPALTGELDTANVNGSGRFAILDAADVANELCTPCGPVAAGIIIGDTSERVSVSDVVCAGNNGNAGQAYGLLHDVSTSAVVQNSQFYQNITNTCGIAFGLAEFNPQSGSVQFGNTAFGNQYAAFVNSNYMVPFDSTALSGLEFPVKVGYNGDITNLANASVYDNIEIRFMYDLPADPTHLPDGVASAWDSLSFTDAASYTSPGTPLTGETLTADSNTQTGATTTLTFDELVFEDAVELWTLTVQMDTESGIALNGTTNGIAVSGTAELSREGFESLTGYTVQGFINITVSNLGVVTAVSIAPNAQAAGASVFKVTSADLQTVLYIQPTFGAGNVTNITSRNVTMALQTLNGITNTVASGSIFDLTDAQTLGLSAQIGGMDLASTALAFSNYYIWNTSFGRTLSSAVTLGGISASLSANPSGVPVNPTVTVTMDGIGRYSSASGTMYIVDGSNRLVATLTVTGLTNLNYVGYNPANPTATITFDYLADGDSTLINNPQLSGDITDLDNIWTGYQLAAINLVGSADIAYSSPGSINLATGSSTATLNGRAMNISGTVNITVNGSGVPSAGNITMTLTDAGLGAVVSTSNTTINFNDLGV